MLILNSDKHLRSHVMSSCLSIYSGLVLNIFQTAMQETFLLTNILPQNQSMNCGLWRDLEEFSRKLTHRYEDVRVVSGPLFLPNSEEKGKTFIKYEVNFSHL